MYTRPVSGGSITQRRLVRETSSKRGHGVGWVQASTVVLVIYAATALADDTFIAGYATAILERELQVSFTSLYVHDGLLTLRVQRLTDAKRQHVIAVLSTIEGVVRVTLVGPEHSGSPTSAILPDGASQDTLKAKPEAPDRRSLDTGFLPSGHLFEPLLADPRWPHFSVAYQRYLDDDELTNVATTSFGETLPLYRQNIGIGGQWQLGIQAAVFAIFDLDADSFDLVNADYLVGIPLSYRYGAFAALMRIFHQSSHLGDEFLLRNRVDRINLSYESIELKLSYDLTLWSRVYAGAGFLMHREPSDIDRWTTQFGVELQSPKAYWSGHVRPVLGADFQSRAEHDWHTDVSIQAGVQLETRKTAEHKIQIMLGYFDGHSPNGQFYRRSVQYISLGVDFYY